MPLTIVEISKKALVYNLRQFKKIAPRGTEVMPVIKSNAYGHGMGEVADILKKHTRYFVVASIEEALALRARGIKNSILVLTRITLGKKSLIKAIN